MAQTSVAQFASELKVQPLVLLEQLKAAVGAFSKQFQISDGTPLIKDLPVDPMVKGAQGQEKIVAHNPAPADH